MDVGIWKVVLSVVSSPKARVSKSSKEISYLALSTLIDIVKKVIFEKEKKRNFGLRVSGFIYSRLWIKLLSVAVKGEKIWQSFVSVSSWLTRIG